MDEKMRFIVACMRGEATMVERCLEFGISRDWGYELWRRYRALGPVGLEPLSCAPHHHGRAMADEIAAAIVALRLERPSWGPKKLRAFLRQRSPAVAWPAASTMGDLLRREGLARPRRRQRRPLPLTRPFLLVRGPNDQWCMDFKGWFRTGDGVRCDPLTITDAHSRFLLECRIVPPTTAGVWPAVERVFREFGLPCAIRTDNGPPFACAQAAGGLTRLAVHWVKLGIQLERIEPGQPQQNGRHERMHGTLKAETSRPPAGSPAAQQARFERFRQDYNHVRPHEALDQTTPASCYSRSPRPCPETLEEPWYSADHAVRRVRSNGEIKWGGAFVFISEALIGEPVGIAETEQGDWIVRFSDIDLGLIDRRSKKLRRFLAGRPARQKAPPAPEQTGETVSDVSGL